MLDAGANTQLKDRQGHTPLELARSRGFEAMVQILERAGAREIARASLTLEDLFLALTGGMPNHDETESTAGAAETE